MVSTVFATKIGMSQAWTVSGKRMPITKCKVENNVVVRTQPLSEDRLNLEIGFGTKNLKNIKKPLRSKLEQSGFSVGVKKLAGVAVAASNEDENAVKSGDTITVEQVLEVGDVVKVQGTTKGRGFAGGIKRHGFSGGPKTHGQSDRERAVGSIGAGTSPGRVWKGKKMPGHYGVDTQTVRGLTVVHVDAENQEVWLSGPVPGHLKALVRIEKLGTNKKIELDKKASGIKEVAQPVESTESEKTEEAAAA